MSERKKENFVSVFENFYVNKIWRVRRYTLEEIGEIAEKERKKIQKFSKCFKFPCRQYLLSLLIRVGKTLRFLLIPRKKKLSFVDTSKEKVEFCQYVEIKS